MPKKNLERLLASTVKLRQRVLADPFLKQHLEAVLVTIYGTLNQPVPQPDDREAFAMAKSVTMGVFTAFVLGYELAEKDFGQVAEPGQVN